ncbi:hypothetical protein E7Z59_04990 [Robertkochia marina]|uniref:Tetratricopeptide repeat protein n=1 Tax=Robertkochia marina TaxID=1227945 RepID=A0A4S3M3F0_9FLAO|nr:hypothetical protein [Robertkochia marina]THD69684.1 hypothetical protein E7Z59_04990 [Robertkochia marina]TRZ46970.1 hypothetical protein D3A96_05225 [Robertkochia marina]
MKKILATLMLVVTAAGFSQNSQELVSHYEAYYAQMKKQGDVRGVIDALTHLEVLSPSEQRRDTLAYFYANSKQYVQALNVLGTEKDANASDLALEIKAISLKALNQPQLAVQQFDIMFGRNPDVYLAYELADLNLQIGKTVEAKTYITYGLENTKDGQMLPFYEAQPPYQVPLKAAFKYQEGLFLYNEDKTKMDEAIKLIDEAIAMAPNFNMAIQIKDILLKQKQAQAAAEEEGQKEENKN